ncbi:MAG: cytochrome P450 [Myxococcales bacterium]|nr:cytochrome P450 [Myxococcales bacterium]
MVANASPRGPRGWPLVGSLPSLAADPLDFMVQIAARYGDVVPYRVGVRPHWTFAHPDAIEALLVKHRDALVKDTVTRSLSRVLGEGLLTSENPLWKRQRRLASPSFRPSHLQAYAEVMVAATQRGVQRVTLGERDVHADLTQITMEVVLETLFGTRGGDAGAAGDAVVRFMEAFEEEIRSARRLLPGWVPTRGRRTVARSREVLKQTLGRIIEERRHSGEERDDLLGRLLAARDDDGQGMSDQQLYDEAITLFAAGHETTALALSYALWGIAHDPELAERLAQERREVLGDRPATFDDLKALVWHEAAVKESLRLYPPAWVVGRRVIEAFEVAGVTLREGHQVLLPQWVVHRDPRWWTQPLQFRPARWRNGETDELPRFAYFPFAGGPRVCIGNHFAMMQGVLSLTTWLQSVSVAPAAGAALSFMPAVTLRPRDGVRLSCSPNA